MNITVNIPQFLGSAFCTAISWHIACGTFQHIFADPLNEMATFVVTSLLAIGLFASSISKAIK